MSRLDELRGARASLALEQEHDDLRELLGDPAFLRFLERLVFQGKMLESAERATDAATHHTIGWQDLAKFVLKRCAEQNPVAVGRMWSDHFTRMALERVDDDRAKLEDSGTDE